MEDRTRVKSKFDRDKVRVFFKTLSREELLDLLDEAREAFDILFGLLRHIDEGHDDVIFFADEGGSWQVGVDWREVLPAWFASLADTADPDEYADAVLEATHCFVSHDKAWFLRKAKSAADSAQNKAIQKLQKKG